MQNNMTPNTPDSLLLGINRASQMQKLEDICNLAAANLRALLEVDQVNICQLQLNDKVQVIAEATLDNKIPSLLSSYISLDDRFPISRRLLFQGQIGVVVNATSQMLFQIPPSISELNSFRAETMRRLSGDSYIFQYMKDVGANIYLVVPIFSHGKPWGLLTIHASEQYISIRQQEMLRTAVDQLSIAIGQDALRIQAKTRVEHEAGLNRITTLLQSSSAPDFQTALKITITLLQSSGGRLYISDTAQDPSAFLVVSSKADRVYTDGLQPAISAAIDSRLMTQYRLWQSRNSHEQYQIWAVSNIYQVPELETLFDAFQTTPIRSLLMIPLVYRQELVGCLSIFHNSVTVIGAQTEQIHPSQIGQGRQWIDLPLAQKLGQQLTMAIHDYQLSQQLYASKGDLNTKLQQHAAQLDQIAQQQKSLSDVLTKIHSATDPETIFQTTTKELCTLLNAERVSVYRFNPDWGGEFIHDFEYAAPEWESVFKSGANTTWNDSYLQSTEGGCYRFHETYVADDIYKANLSECFIRAFEQFEIKAFATAPIYMGKQLWGILAAYQHSQPRHWLTTDILFLSQAATSLGLAMQHTTVRQQHTTQLNQIAQQQKSLSDGLIKIHSVSNVAQIFKTTTKELCTLLKAERVSVYRFNADWGGEFIHDFEYATVNWRRSSKLGGNTAWNDTYLQESQGGRYRFNEVFAADDVYQANLSSCHVDILKQFEIKAFLTAPIFVGDQLWGVLAAYQHSQPRHWLDTDVLFLCQTATSLGLALRQTESQAQSQTERQQNTTQLDQIVQQQESLSEMLTKILMASDPETIFRTAAKDLCALLKADRISVYRFNKDWGGEFMPHFGYATPDWRRSSRLGANTVWNDTYLQETQGGCYRFHETYVADDIYKANLSECFIKVFEQFEIKAFATAPIYMGKQLWGVLAAYQHSRPRHWSTTDVLFLSQAAISLGLALQHTDTLGQISVTRNPELPSTFDTTDETLLNNWSASKERNDSSSGVR